MLALRDKLLKFDDVWLNILNGDKWFFLLSDTDEWLERIQIINEYESVFELPILDKGCLLSIECQHLYIVSKCE